MTEFAVVDASALIATSDSSQRGHAECQAVLARPDLRFVIPALCVAETVHLLQRYLGTAAEAMFLENLRDVDVRAPEPEDWLRIGALVRQYADFPLGGTDASVIVLAERLKTDTVVSLDRRHLMAVRPRHCESLRVLPG